MSKFGKPEFKSDDIQMDDYDEDTVDGTTYESEEETSFGGTIQVQADVHQQANLGEELNLPDAPIFEELMRDDEVKLDFYNDLRNKGIVDLDLDAVNRNNAFFIKRNNEVFILYQDKEILLTKFKGVKYEELSGIASKAGPDFVRNVPGVKKKLWYESIR